MSGDNCIYNQVGSQRIEKAIKMLDGKWKLRILYIIEFNRVMRYGELKRTLSTITHKMLSVQLKELEKDGLLIREYPQIPPKVEYSMSKIGYDLLPMFDELCNWILKNGMEENTNS